MENVIAQMLGTDEVISYSTVAISFRRSREAKLVNVNIGASG